MKAKKKTSASGSVRQLHEISVVLACKRQVNQFFFFCTKFFCNLMTMQSNLKSPSLELGNLATVKNSKAEVSSVSPSSERMEELWVV